MERYAILREYQGKWYEIQELNTTYTNAKSIFDRVVSERPLNHYQLVQRTYEEKIVSDSLFG